MTGQDHTVSAQSRQSPQSVLAYLIHIAEVEGASDQATLIGYASAFTLCTLVNLHVFCRLRIISSPEPLGLQGELIVYPSSRRPSVRRRRPSSFTMLKDLLLRNRWADQSQILCGASLGRGNDILFAPSWSHDPYMVKNPSKIFFSRTGGPIFTKLGM